MTDYINFIEEDFSKLTLEEIEDNNFNKIKIEGVPLIFYLIRKNKIEIIKHLLEYSGGPSVIDLNIKELECTPLLEACYENNFEIVKLLVGKVSKEIISNHEISIKNSFETTPLFWACYYNNFEMITLLLENGAIPCVDEEGNYECLRGGGFEVESKKKLRDFIFKFQTQNIKKVK